MSEQPRERKLVKNIKLQRQPKICRECRAGDAAAVPALAGVAAAALTSATATVMDARPGHCSRRGTGGGGEGAKSREGHLGQGEGLGAGEEESRREGANTRGCLALVAFGRGGVGMGQEQQGLWKILTNFEN